MRVIILSWEFPPRKVGKLANYVKELAVNLVEKRVDTYLVTYHDFLTGAHEEPEGITTFRVCNPVHTHIGVLTWVLTLNQEVERAAADFYYKTKENIDLIDVHDWHFVHAAVTLKKAFTVPFIYSVDSLEEHRSHGTHSPFNMSIRSIEWLGFYEAEKVIVKSEWMKDEVVRIYEVPPDKIRAVNPQSETWSDDIFEIYQEVVGEMGSK